MTENTTAMGQTMVSVVVNLGHVLTKVTKSFIWDSPVILHIVGVVRMFCTALTLVQVLVVMRVPVVTQHIPGVARIRLVTILP